MPTARTPEKIYATPPDEFTTHVRMLQQARQNLDDINAENASAWKSAKKAGIHNEAMKLCLKLKKQEATKTADFLRAFDAYVDTFGLRTQSDLLDQQQAQETDNAANADSIGQAGDDVTDPDFEEDPPPAATKH